MASDLTADDVDRPGPVPAAVTARASWVRRLAGPLLLLAVIGSLALALRSAGVTGVDELRDLVDDAGLWAPILFVVLYALLTVALAPGSIGSAAAGLIFGGVAGTLLTIVGATIGATASFVLGRALGRDTVVSLFGTGLDRLDRFVGDRPFRSVVAIRLLPVLPFGLVNYGASFTNLPLRSYVAGTTVGIVPGSALYVALGASLDTPGSARFWASLGGLALFTVVGVVLVRRSPPTGSGATA
ncbi:MAG: TVP38/TMEM64 family protein [Actinomycetota bacterium]